MEMCAATDVNNLMGSQWHAHRLKLNDSKAEFMILYSKLFIC